MRRLGTASPAAVTRTYYALILGNTIAASLIWGVNTIFLLDAGLDNLEAFAANAAFTAGMVIFEVPTGIVADLIGRRASFLLGTVTLAVTTLLYVLLWRLEAPFWQWAVVSLLLGLGFTFFSGATEAWLIDALDATGYTGSRERVFGRGQVMTGIGMLTGSIAGGYLAQATNLGVPFLLRAAILCGMFVVALLLMHDLGFDPERGRSPVAEMGRIVRDSRRYGWDVPAVRWLMLAAPWSGGVSIYAFYALQPYLLDLYGDPEAYGIAGLAAAILALAQMAGGFIAPVVRRGFRLRTSALVAANVAGAATLVAMGLLQSFVAVIALVVAWGLLWSAAMPIRQAYLNDLIPSRQRATILSFDSLMSSTGGVVAQPVLGRSADVYGYPASYVAAGIIQAAALPFLLRARREEPRDVSPVGEPAAPAG